jgi:heme exporter protein D
MSNWNVPTNKTCCGDGDVVYPRAEIFALTLFSLTVLGICLLTVMCAVLHEKMARAQVQESAASQESREERMRKRKESIENGLIVKEWATDDLPVESTGGDQDTPTSGEGAVEASQPPAPAPPINSPTPPINTSSPASCAMGSDDCESLAGEEEMAGCAICPSRFKPQQLVCESDNSSCQHVFHKDCMVDWLMNHHAECPLCREVYVRKICW